MGTTNATTKHARSGTSGASTPESRMAEVFTPSEEKSDQSSPSEDGQDDARWAGEQVLTLLKGVDQKKLIALLQSGALEPTPGFQRTRTWGLFLHFSETSV